MLVVLASRHQHIVSLGILLGFKLRVEFLVPSRLGNYVWLAAIIDGFWRGRKTICSVA